VSIHEEFDPGAGRNPLFLSGEEPKIPSEIHVTKCFSTLGGAVRWVDDLLDADDFKRVVDFAAASTFVPADERNQELIWAQNNRSAPAMAHNMMWPEFAVHRRFMAAVPNVGLYPAGSPLDAALKAIREISLDTGIAGRVGADWVGIISTVFKYERSAGLIFHTDATGYSGAFTYYLNREWDADWGGHLLFTRDDPRRMSGGEFLTPQPNRLVLMRAGVPHSISTVGAPDGVSRLALSGFFVRPDRIAEIIKLYIPK
jgi:hypothetical protein